MQTFDPSRFIVLGEGIAAGFTGFSWDRSGQANSFPALAARQMGVPLRQPLFEPSGPADSPGFEKLPIVIPGIDQQTMLDSLPPAAIPFQNLSIPGLTVQASLSMEPAFPLIWRDNALQTAVNLVCGLGPLSEGTPGSAAAQLAAAMRPTLALIELGFAEALEAALRGDPAAFGEQDIVRGIAEITAALAAAGAAVVACTIPDPFDTAVFFEPAAVCQTALLSPEALAAFWPDAASGVSTLAAVNEIGFQIFAGARGALPAAGILRPEAVRQLRDSIARCNEAIRLLPATIFDLHKLFSRVRQSGVAAGTRHLSARYLGGFFGLHGAFPGETAQGVLANELLGLLNTAFGSRYPAVGLDVIMAGDPAAACAPAQGRLWTVGELQAVFSRPSGRAAIEVAPPDPLHESPALPLQLPPNLEQLLALNPAASYFGDAIGAVNCRLPAEAQWGSGGHYLFGGCAMVDSHIQGNVRLRFTPPQNGVTQFTIGFEGGFRGGDQVLAAPRAFRMAFQSPAVLELPGLVSGGKLNLATGEVFDLQVFAQYSASALNALVGVNPNFPRPDKSPMSFPGAYGSAWARFDPRPGGGLDLTFYGSTFVPLGPGTRWPLNFHGPERYFATVPANGTVMHPHLALTTRESSARRPASPPVLPENEIREFTLHSHNSAFGDAFTLTVPELGGPAKGRSHIMGRVQLQFGPRCGNTVPVLARNLGPGGVLGSLPQSPITRSFPAALPLGPQGFYEMLRFPFRTYALDELAILDDPFDISVAAFDVTTGASVCPMLHRGLIEQDLIYSLMRVEPRTPKSSFHFRGPALFQTGAPGSLAFRFNGIVRVPYPAGFRFPQPNLTEPYIVGPGSMLDPYLWLRAVEDCPPPAHGFEMSGSRAVSSMGEFFSYRCRIASSALERSEFIYENHSQGGEFRMKGLNWVSFSRSLTGQGSAADTVTFACYGFWTKDRAKVLVPAAVQLCLSPVAPYVGIQIDSSDISNANTKPMDEQEALP